MMHKSNRRIFFWFNSQVFTLRAIQILVLVECFYMALYVLVFIHRINLVTEGWSSLITFLLHLLAITPPVMLIFVFLPLVLPVFSLLSHVESLTDRKHLRYILTYDERVKAKQAAHDADDDDDTEEDPDHGKFAFGQRGGGVGGMSGSMDAPLLRAHQK